MDDIKINRTPEIKVSSTPQSQSATPKPKPSLTSELRSRPVVYGFDKRFVIAAAGTAGAIILILIGLFIRTQYQLSKVTRDLKQQQTDPTAQIRQENKKLIEAVGKLIVLPKDEEPTIATVSDLTKLKDQPFFAKAELGDKVLIYNNNKKAILYRPSTNQVIELAPLIDQNTNQ